MTKMKPTCKHRKRAHNAIMSWLKLVMVSKKINIKYIKSTAHPMAKLLLFIMFFYPAPSTREV